MWTSRSELLRALDELDVVAVLVVEHCGFDLAHRRRRHGELHALSGEALVLAADVIHVEPDKGQAVAVELERALLVLNTASKD